MPRELFENVSGNSVYFSEFSSSITFATKSDALLACLLEKHDPGVWALADDLLELFRDAQFKPNAVTFKCAGDHSDRISQERRSLAQVRSTHNSQESFSTVPSAVVSLTAGHIYSESRLPIDHPHSWNNNHRTLKSMALVHRSWTEAVQAWLRHRLVICDMSRMPGLPKNPLLGPWVHEFKCSYMPILDRPVRVLNQHHLCGILERCPNLTRFYFDAVDILSPTEYGFFDQLGHLTSLENLWLHGDDSGVYAYAESERLWRVLKKLPLLRSLSIVKVFRADPDKRSIRGNPFGRDRKNHLPPTLGCSITDTQFFLQCTEMTTLPTVTICHVDTSSTETVSEKRYAELSTLLHRCPSLAVLVLRIRRKIDFHFMKLTLPVWTRSLHLHLDSRAVHPDIEDEVTMALLRSSSPRLREMTISTDNYDFLSEWGDSTEEDIPPFTATQKMCQRRNVKLHLFESDFEPSLIRYPWTPESHIINRTR